MSGPLGTIEKGAAALGALLQRLIGPLDAADPGPALRLLVADLGWTLPDPVPPSLLTLKNSVTTLTHSLERLQALVDADGGDAAVGAAAVEVVAAVEKVVDTFATLPAALAAELPPAYAAATGFADDFVPRLFEVLVVDALWQRLPITSRVLRLLGLLEIARQPADPARFQPDFTLRRIHWERLTSLLGDPAQVMRDVYGWGSPALELQPIHDALFSLSFAIGFPGAYDYPSHGLLATVAPGVPSTAPRADRIFELVLLDMGLAKVTAALTSIPKANPTEQQGVALALTTEGSVATLTIPIRSDLTLTFDVSVDASAGIALALRPGQPPSLFANFEAASTAVSDGHLTGTLQYARGDAQDPFTILSFPGGSRVEARAAYVSGGLGRSRAGDLDPFAEVGLRDGKIVISMSLADGFLAQLLPSDGLRLDFDIGAGWSHLLGVYVRGSAGLVISIPTHIDLGPLSIEYLYLAVGLKAGGLTLEVSVSGTGSLGPLSASVDRVGLSGTVNLPDHSGTLGPANLALAFKPPNGVGLAIDAGVVTGGGYLYIDVDQGEYAGALQLMVGDFLSLTAIGLITTRMPDGSSGFSLLIVITADFGAGVQLGFGFTLNAVGGLLGLNRTMLFQPLIEGMRSGAIETIMFPRDVIANAPRIISDLRTIFPPQPGVFLIGPMAKLGWGEPTLVSLSLGVIIQIPPGDVAILGVLRLALPAEEADILVLQVNFAGALEFDKQRLYFFASLFDSHILFITIEGEMGLLFAYGADGNFVVTVGGFHPQFNPPPLPFPSPKRIQVDVINESYARIRCEGYFAVTTNTAQFGAHSEFFFGFDALSVQGHSGFDALFQFSPFHFSVSISSSFSVQVFGLGVFGIDIDLTLEGPTPWHAHGTASISFFFFSIGIGIDFTWGDSRETTLAPVEVMPILARELAKQSNWRAVLPSGSNLLVSLRKLSDQEAEFVLHPVGTLQVSQRAVPLDLVLDSVGNTKPSDGNRFALTVTSGDLGRRRDLQEQFAPAQFKSFADATRLSQPAYVPMNSGIELSAVEGAYASGTAITRNVRYDLTVIDTKRRRLLKRFFEYSGSLFVHLLRGASVSRSVFSAYRSAQTHPFEERVVVAPEMFAVARQSDNSVFNADAGSFTSQAAAEDFLDRAVASDPTIAGTLHVLPRFEVAA